MGAAVVCGPHVNLGFWGSPLLLWTAVVLKGTRLWKETLPTKSHFNLSHFWALWCKWVTVKPQVGWKSFLFLKITLSPRGWEYVKSKQAIYFGPPKVFLGAGGKYAGALSGYGTHPLDRRSILLIALKGKWDTGKINWFAHRWTESLQLYQELKPIPDPVF